MKNLFKLMRLLFSKEGRALLIEVTEQLEAVCMQKASDSLWEEEIAARPEVPEDKEGEKEDGVV